MTPSSIALSATSTNGVAGGWTVDRDRMGATLTQSLANAKATVAPTGHGSSMHKPCMRLTQRASTRDRQNVTVGDQAQKRVPG